MGKPFNDIQSSYLNVDQYYGDYVPFAAGAVASPAGVDVPMSVWIGFPESPRSVTRDAALESTTETVIATNAAETPATHTRLYTQHSLYTIIIITTTINTSRPSSSVIVVFIHTYKNLYKKYRHKTQRKYSSTVVVVVYY